MALHDMAVRTVRRIAGQIAPAFAVSKRERTQPGKNAEQRNENDREREDHPAARLAGARECRR